MSNKTYKLGVIGLGHMGSALVEGAIEKGLISNTDIAVFDPSEAAKEKALKAGYTMYDSIHEVIENAHMIMLAVTPQKCDDVLACMKDETIDVMFSIVTGVSVKYLKDHCNDCPVIRAMPNTPLQLGEGATAICRSDDCNAEDFAFIMNMLGAMGKVAEMEEERISEAVIINGSTPAYFYMMADAILKDAINRGFDEAKAKELIVQTMIGAGKMLQNSPDTSISTFINQVATKGGTTIQAVTSMQEDGFYEMIEKASAKCADRAKELSR